MQRLIVGLCCWYCHAVPAGDFDGGSLLFARQTSASPQPTKTAPTLQRINASGVQPATDVPTALGSVWKLFVYAYAMDQALPLPPYLCRGGEAAKEELFCCNPGESVNQDAALVQSCGRFFEPARLHLNAKDWQYYWQNKAPDVPWLAELAQLNPARKVSVSSLLQALSSIDGKAREQTESALLGLVINGRGQSALPLLGGRYRVKTFTWDHPQRSDSVVGGAAGWMSDGSSVWFGALGSSLKVLQDYAQQLAQVADHSTTPVQTGRCVDVAMFARYPIKQIHSLTPGVAVAIGVEQDLRGLFSVEFVNGNRVKLQSNNEIRLRRQDKTSPLLTARLTENEYIARVIDREADASKTEAARALSIVARTYLLQNGTRQGLCLHMRDSSHAQRVSPVPATKAARDTASFTSGLMLLGVNAQYRSLEKSPNVLSWRQAVELANQGKPFDEILRLSFAQATLASINGEATCLPLPEAERWLRLQAKKWRRVLQMEAGFEPPQPRVCQLSFGNPYSDITHQRIFVRGLTSLNNRLTLAHEYLHLAFAAYPSGQDENYIEQWARRLIEGES